MNKPPENIKKHLLPLWELLPSLEERNQDHGFWVQLEDALKNYLLYDIQGISPEMEDAFQNFLIAVYKNPVKYTPTEDPTLQDSFFKVIALIRLGFSTHMMRVHRSDVQEEIRVMEYKSRRYGLNSSEKDELERLKNLKKKL